jgi:hypothetical protein
MPGASAQTRRVTAVNANWVPADDHADGQFELMLVTDDDEQHFLRPSPATTTTLVALARTDAVLLWDPTNRTLIAGNIVGKWLARE